MSKAESIITMCDLLTRFGGVADHVGGVKIGHDQLRKLIDFIREQEAEKKAILEVARKMVSWIRCPAEPPPPGHTCGPEGNCDCLCMTWGHYQDDLAVARKIITKAEKELDHENMPRM